MAALLSGAFNNNNMKSPFIYYFLAPALLWALPAQADLSYSDQPLYLNKGVKPNVALLMDDSSSLSATDTASYKPYLNTCTGVTVTGTGLMTRLEVAKVAACRTVQDNANNMGIGLYSFAGSTANQDRPFNSSIPNLLSTINAFTGSETTPLSGALTKVVNDYTSATLSPIQYRCQKNFVVFFTDGLPNTGVDTTSTHTLPSTAGSQSSTWPGSTAVTGVSSTTPSWDGLADPQIAKAVGGGPGYYYPWLDDIAQMAYDVDAMQVGSAATRPCPVGSILANSTNGVDCANKSWDGSDDTDPNLYRKQNVVTYTIGLGAEANNELLRDTALTNRINILPADVDVGADIITIPAHGLEEGDYVHYHTAYESEEYVINATANPGTDILSGDTTHMQAGGMLTYNKNSGASAQYQLLTTPAVPATNCGAISGLTSGNNYYVAQRSATEFRLSTSSANAYLSSALADSNSSVATYSVNLASLGTANTVHAFTRNQASAGFISTGSGTTPVDNTVNVEKIIRSNHGLNTGDQVTYTCTGTSCAIGGLSSGSTYYVARRSADEFRLSTSASLATFCAESADGVVGFGCIDLTSRGSAGGVQTFSKTATATATSFSATGSGTTPVNTTANVEKITATAAHGFGTGDRVTYTCTNFAGTPAVYTSYDVPTTLYAKNVVAGNPGTFQLSLTSGGATLDISHAGNVAQNFAWTNITSQAGIGGLFAYETDMVPDATPSPVTESAARGKYFVEVVDDDKIKLHQCGDVADCTIPAVSAVNLTSAGQGVLSTGPGKARFVLTGDELMAAMDDIFKDIRQDNLPTDTGMMGSAISANTTIEWSANTRFHQTVFNPLDWSGDVRTYQLGSGEIDPAPEWEASTKLPFHTARNILTRNNNNGAFSFTAANWGNLTAIQQNALSNGVSTTVGQQVINWLRGEDVAGYRMRTDSKLGDMLNSSPVYVGQPNETYANSVYGLPDSDPGKATYNLFRTVVRTPMVYVGANDGMLHGFNADVNFSTQGVERFAFIPESVYMDWNDLDNDGIKDAGEQAINKFYALGQEFYGQGAAQPHHYFVDGTPVTGDAFFTSAKAGLPANSWHTVLVGGLGKGGRSVYALDITDDNFVASDVLWEFNDSNSGDMGYSYSKPAIARLSSGQWVAIFGNGYDSRNDQARLYIVNLETGALIQEITLGGAGNNGLSSVSVLRSNTVADGVTASTVYAGDLQGNVWKVDISNAAALPASVSTPFFVAQDSSSNRQAITSAITLQRYADLDVLDGGAPQAGLMLFFGTGAYFTNDDQGFDGTPVYDSLYGIWDRGDMGTVEIYDLAEQQLGTIALDPDGDEVFEEYRAATANPVNYSGANPDKGWYMKLAVTLPSFEFKGERVVFAPVATASGSYVLFTSVIPADADPCASGGSSNFYALDALSGGSKPYAVFDLNDDGSFDDDTTGVVGFSAKSVLSKPLAIFDVEGGQFKVCVTASNGLVTCENLVADSDGDGILDINDAFPLDPAEWFDTDGDSIGNNADWDDDNDGVPDVVDAAPLDAGETSEIVLPLDGTYKGDMLENRRFEQ